LQEETGVMITEDQLNSTFMSERWCGTDGQLYEARCWIAIIPDEIPVTGRLSREDVENHPGEIGDVNWLTQEEILQKARPWSIRLLYRANDVLVPRLDLPNHNLQDDDGPPTTPP
jgi:hypothetical protein